MHVTQETVDRLRAGRLAPAAIAELGRHTGSCDACRDRVAASMNVRQLVQDVRVQLDVDEGDADHLGEDAAAAFVDGGMTPAARIAAEAHLAECDECWSDVAELKRIRADLQKRKPRRFLLPASIAATLVLGFSGLLMLRRQEPAIAPVVPQKQTPVAQKPPAAVPPEPAPNRYEDPRWTRLVDGAVATGRIELPATLVALQSGPAQFRGETPDSELTLAPRGEMIQETRPRFTWSARPGATYTLLLSNDRDVFEHPTGTTPSWRPDAPLARGVEYSWQVEVAIDGERELYPRSPRPPARFRILGHDAAREIESARERHPDDHLLLAVLLAHHGLRRDAERELEQLSRTDADLARTLRESMTARP